MTAIDRFLPGWDVNEVHDTLLDVEPEEALAAALAAPAAPGAVRVLLRLRGLRAAGSIESLLLGMGFQVLAREAGEVVFGASGKPWRPRGAVGSFGDPSPGSVRIVASFLAERLPDGRTRLSTETRVAACDDDARRAFRRYWRVVGPFSALVRRRWLAAIRSSLAART
ncbi:MAG: hypothetical protein H0U08_06700 [Actinobacteria bacterium]|nr:hypothetical protein [Actinomycetota bacterium]